MASDVTAKGTSFRSCEYRAGMRERNGVVIPLAAIVTSKVQTAAIAQ